MVAHFLKISIFSLAQTQHSEGNMFSWAVITPRVIYIIFKTHKINVNLAIMSTSLNASSRGVGHLTGEKLEVAWVKFSTLS